MCYCQFLLLWLLVFALYTFMLLCSVQFSQGIYIYNCYIFSLDWSLDHYVVSFFVSYNCLLNSILSDISIAIPAFFWFPFGLNTFFRALTFSLYVYLGLWWVSCRQGVCVCVCVCVCSVAQSHLTLCNPMDSSLPGSFVHRIIPARILEQVAISSSRGSSQPRDKTRISWSSCIGRILYHWVTWQGQDIYRSCFRIHSVSLCLLVGLFNLFTFKVIINTCIPTTIFLNVFHLLL